MTGNFVAVSVAEAAYLTYSENADGKHHIPALDFDSLPKKMKVQWEKVAKAVLVQWLETDFRDAVNDDARVEANAVRMVIVGRKRNDPPAKVFRTAITAFVWDVIAPGEIERLMAESDGEPSDDAE